MPSEAPAPIELPAEVWTRPDVLDMCRRRDAGALLRLANSSKFRVSQGRLAYWMDTEPGVVNKMINGKSGDVLRLDKWERIADALNMPDSARIALGLAPRSSVRADVAEPALPLPVLNEPLTTADGLVQYDGDRLVNDETMAPLFEALGDLLASFRKGLSWTQRRLADQIGYSRTTIAVAETAVSFDRLGSDAFWRSCDTALAADGVLYRAYQEMAETLASRHRERARAAEATRQLKVDSYRAQIDAAPTRGIHSIPGRIDSGDPTEDEYATGIVGSNLRLRLNQTFQLAHGMVEPSPSKVEVLDLEETANIAAREALTQPPAVMVSRLMGTFQAAQDLAQSSLMFDQQRSVRRSAARTAILLGEELMVLGEIQQSRRWFTVGERLGERVGDSNVVATAIMLHARLPLYFGEVGEAVEMARRAQDAATQADDVVLSLAPMVEALALAQLGDSSAAVGALDLARQSFEAREPDTQEESIFGFSSRRFHFYESRVLLDAEQLSSAWEVQDRAFALYPVEEGGDVTILKLDRARLLMRRGELKEGCSLAVDTLTAIPTEQRATIYLNRGWRALAAVPKKEYRSSGANQLRDTLTELTGSI